MARPFVVPTLHQLPPGCGAETLQWPTTGAYGGYEVHLDTPIGLFIGYGQGDWDAFRRARQQYERRADELRRTRAQDLASNQAG